MKRPLFLLLILCTVLIYNPLYGQGMKGKFALSGTSGPGFPLGDFSDKEMGRAQTGYGLGGNLEYFVTDNLSLGMNFSYHRFGMYVKDLEENFIRYVYESIPDADTSGIDIDAHKSVIQLGFFYKCLFLTGTKFSPYVKLGGGWGKLKGLSDQPGYIKYPTYTESIESEVHASYDGDFYIDVGWGLLYLFSDRIGISSEFKFTHFITEGNLGTVITKTRIDSDSQEIKEKKTLDYNSSYINLFLSLSFFF